MNAEGHLNDIDFLDLLVGLWRERFIGAVRAENDAIIKIIYFRDGDLLSASTNDRGDSLGEILLRSGKTSREHLKQAMAKRKEEESLGESLLGLGFISRRELTWARRTQLVGAIRSIVEWKSGEYNVIPDYVPKRDEGPPFVFPQVLLEVILTRTDREKVDRELELGSLVFETRPEFEHLYPQLNLNEEADGIVKLIDGRRSAVRVAVGSDADRFNVFKLLVALKRLGLIAVTGEAARPEETPIEPPEEAPFITTGDEIPEEEEGEWSLADELQLEDAVGTVERPPAIVAPPVEIAPPSDTPPPPAVAAQAPEPRRSFARHWQVAVLLVAAVAVLAATVYFVRVLKPVSGAGVPREASATAGNTAPAQPSPPPIVVEATPTPPPVLVAEATPAPSPMATLPAVSPTPAPTIRPSPTAGQIIVARMSTDRPATTAVSPAPVDTPNDPARARFDAMADQYASSITARYAVQFGIFCRTESIEKAIAAGGESVWFVPAIFRGQRCYRAYWGRYEERAAAEAAIAQLPPALREGTRPSVIQLAR